QRCEPAAQPRDIHAGRAGQGGAGGGRSNGGLLPRVDCGHLGADSTTNRYPLVGSATAHWSKETSMRRILGLISLVVGAFALLLGVLAKPVIYDSLAKVELDQETVSVSRGEGMSALRVSADGI